jgi:hypothetical protein
MRGKETIFDDDGRERESEEHGNEPKKAHKTKNERLI